MGAGELSRRAAWFNLSALSGQAIPWMRKNSAIRPATCFRPKSQIRPGTSIEGFPRRARCSRSRPPRASKSTLH